MKKPGWQFLSQMAPSRSRCSEHGISKRRILGVVLGAVSPFLGLAPTRIPREFPGQHNISSPSLGYGLLVWVRHWPTPGQSESLPWVFLNWNKVKVMHLSAVQVAPECWRQAFSETCFLSHEGSQSVDEGGMTESYGVQALVSSCSWVPAHTPDYGPLSF